MLEPQLDMYADDFAEEEREKLNAAVDKKENTPEETGKGILMWEIKWQQDSSEVDGPYTTEQMLKWSNEGRFRKGAWVKKCGENTNFYTVSRIDFELYI